MGAGIGAMLKIKGGLRQTQSPFLKNLKIEPPYDLTIQLLGIHPKEWKASQRETSALVFGATLFTVASTWLQPRRPSTDESASCGPSIHRISCSTGEPRRPGRRERTSRVLHARELPGVARFAVGARHHGCPGLGRSGCGLTRTAFQSCSMVQSSR